ncbi:MAG TPA: hypothetical protein VK009_25810 [Chloroflexota bacterium]|nr:hypothetical protein [Chloroflexota bacterium]
MASVMGRGDLIASNMEKVPDEAYVSLAAASVFTSIGLYLMGRKDEAMFVGLLGSAFSTMAGIMKLLSMQRNHSA